MKKAKKRSTTSRPRLQKIPWVLPRIPRRRTRTGSEIEPEEPPRPSKIPELPFSFPPLSHSSKPFLESLSSRPSLEKTPKTFWIRRLFKAVFKVEPDKPKRMPRFPTLSFPPLYSRYSIMKTYTAITDVDGKITVTFPRVFRKVPGVVISPQDAGTWFEHVLSKNEFGFTVQILKTAHKHQHADSGDGGGHSHGGSSDWGGSHEHVILSDGAHWHTVGGSLTYTVDLAVVSLYATGDAGGHSHTNPATGGPSDTETVVTGLEYGSFCDVGDCVSGEYTAPVASDSHTHSQGDTGAEADHYHSSAWDSAYFVKSIDAVTAWTTSTHIGHNHPEDAAGTHDHAIAYETDHHHAVPDSNEKEAALLPNTSVTFTYFAQEETT